MNRSFSKIRHIQEANKLLEQRMFSENRIISEWTQMLEQYYGYTGFGAPAIPTTKWKTDKIEKFNKNNDWNNFKCVYNRTDKRETTFGDNVTPSVFTIEEYTYYVDGALTFSSEPTETAGKYKCDGNQITITEYPVKKKTTDKITPETPVKSEKGGGIKYKYCRVVDGLEKSCYNEKHVKRLQGCLGFTGRNVDGYFGNKTENTLHQKFPEYKGKKIFTPDIDKICGVESPKLEPGTGVLLPQERMPVPEIPQAPTTPIQPVQSTTGTNMVPSLKIDTKTQGAAIQQKILDLKKRNPNLSNEEIAAILKGQGIEIPKG